MPGWGAYVHEEEYKAHITNYIDQPEVRVTYSFAIYLIKQIPDR
jgi:hypothetical protein